jgi:hypothetical protein
MRCLALGWVALLGPAVGFVVGQKLIGVDCQLSPTAGADALAALGRAGDVMQAGLNSVSPFTLLNPLIQGGLRMLTDPMTWLLWLLLAALTIAAIVWWLLRRNRPVPAAIEEIAAEPIVSTAPSPPGLPWGRECKLAIGSAGIKSIVREGRIEDAYGVRLASETAFEAYADFDKQQERVALANRVPGPGFLALSETLAARSSLSEGLGNRPPNEVWAMREEWMPAVSHFIEETALSLRAASVWPARLTADLSAGGHGLPGLYALAEAANEFPRADRHTHFIVPEGDVERIETIRLLDALRFGDLAMGLYSEPMPWKNKLPLALTTMFRDNRQGRENLDEVAAHIGAALSARVRFETATSENQSNLLRRLTKHGPHTDAEPCPLTFHYAEGAVPITRDGTRGSIERTTLLPIADGVLRALRNADGVIHAIDANIARHLLLVTVPCSDWEDVQQVEQYVLERLEFAGPPDRQCIGVFFSGYRPDAASREERVFAIRLGAVAGGWDAVYRSIRSANYVVRSVPAERVNGAVHELKPSASDSVVSGPEPIA